MFSFQLKPDELEENYRDQMLPNDKVQMRTILLLGILAISMFTILDFSLLMGFPLKISIISRTTTVLITLIFIWITYRLTKIKDFDLAVWIWGMILVSHMLVTTAVRPGDNVTIVSWDILVIFCIYIASPITLRLQMTVALYLTFGSGFVLLLYKEAIPWQILQTIGTFAAYLFANIFGVYFSLKINRLRRHQFVQFKNEEKIKKELEKTMDEVTMVRGIIPICSFCKNVRNDQGYYESVEAYIRNHSEANFSHTVCPDCAEKHFADIDEGD